MTSEIKTCIVEGVVKVEGQQVGQVFVAEACPFLEANNDFVSDRFGPSGLPDPKETAEGEARGVASVRTGAKDVVGHKGSHYFYIGRELGLDRANNF